MGRQTARVFLVWILKTRPPTATGAAWKYHPGALPRRHVVHMVLQTVPGDFKAESAATPDAVGCSERLSRARGATSTWQCLLYKPGPGGGSRITLPGPLHACNSTEDKDLVS